MTNKGGKSLRYNDIVHLLLKLAVFLGSGTSIVKYFYLRSAVKGEE